MMADKKIWVLGGKSARADKNITWLSEIPNLSNCDILIIDLNTFPPSSKDDIPIREINRYLTYSLMAGKNIYIILSPNSLPNMLPLNPILIKIKPSIVDKISGRNHINSFGEIDDYCKYVETCPFFIDMVDAGNFWGNINPRSHWKIASYDFTNSINDYIMNDNFAILNKAKQNVGRSVYILLTDFHENEIHSTGNFIFLPPPTKISSIEAIDVLINAIIGTEFKETKPSWVSNIILPRVKLLNSNIIQKQKDKNKIQIEIEKLKAQKNDIEKYLKLLWTDGNPLQEIVKSAFILLGFSEIKLGRSKSVEDWIIEFHTVETPKFGLCEVKGALKHIKMEDLDQTKRWVDDFLHIGKITKGIFIPNQFRRAPISDQRIKFDYNQIQFAKKREICILPTLEIYKAVVEVLKGNKITRDSIEKKILEADPICKLVDDYTS